MLKLSFYKMSQDLLKKHLTYSRGAFVLGKRNQIGGSFVSSLSITESVLIWPSSMRNVLYSQAAYNRDLKVGQDL